MSANPDIAEMFKQFNETTADITANVDGLRKQIDEMPATPVRRPLAGPTTASDPVLKEFVTPGSTVKEMWVRPTRELVMGSADRFVSKATGDPYITTDTGLGSAYWYVPELWRSVVMGMLDSSGVLECSPTLVVTNHVRPIRVPVLTGEAVATAGDEGDPATAASTTGDKIDLGAFRYDGYFTCSAEMLMSSDYDLGSLLTTFATRATGQKVAALLAMGGGTTEPQGVFDVASGITVGKTTASSTAITVTELVQCMQAVPKGYRKNSKICVSDALMTSLLTSVDDSNEYLLNTLAGPVTTFMGHEIHSEPQADQSGISATEVHGVMGDFSGLFVRLSPLWFRRSDADPLNPIFVFAIWIDAQVADANALVTLKSKT